METSAERKLEYHAPSSTLYFIGEAFHGLWKYRANNGTVFWYCAMGNSSGFPEGGELWQTILRSEQVNQASDMAALGLSQSQYGNADIFNVIRLYPIEGKTKVWRNSIEGAIEREDYAEVPWDDVLSHGRFFYYQNKSTGYTAIAIQFPYLEEPPGVAAGDVDLHDFTCPSRTGYKSRCDGYLVDIAFKTTLTFASNAQNALRTVIDPDDESTIVVTPGAFDTDHGNH